MSSSIDVMMTSYNQPVYLDAQLQSIADQTLGNIHVILSDDSTDPGVAVVAMKHRENWRRGSFILKRGPGRGSTANFVELIRSNPGRANFYAFADHDDLWDSDKLKVAIDHLQTIPDGRPGLYCGRTRIISADGRQLGLSKMFSRKPSFANAIVQSIAGGNTMVFNLAALKLLQRSLSHRPIVAHDWWAYLVVTGNGGSVYYDPEPHISYRQHIKNEIGENRSWRARFIRISMVLSGRFVEWNSTNLNAMQEVRELFDPPSQKILDGFYQLRERGGIRALAALIRLGIHRQTVLGNLGLYLATLLGKV